ncbi:hypothetical protein WMY93_016710 [Mugilogobius chulae]|uniref:Uncharacterized protein n=1 Tax=Mugilogobius chulae TaxID=88201 RepID=A0AAW0NMC7_9GOBI
MSVRGSLEPESGLSPGERRGVAQRTQSLVRLSVRSRSHNGGLRWAGSHTLNMAGPRHTAGLYVRQQAPPAAKEVAPVSEEKQQCVAAGLLCHHTAAVEPSMPHKMKDLNPSLLLDTRSPLLS